MAAGAPSIRTISGSFLQGAASSILPARTAVLLLIVTATMIRCLFVAWTGLDENGAYSAAVALPLSWSYFDHPPLHYWLVGAVELLSGGKAAFLLRLPFILLSAGSTWILFRLTAMCFGERAGLWAAVDFTLCPSFSLVFAGFVTPDGPLIFFLLLASFLVAKALFFSAKWKNGLWAGAGVAAGASLLSKYSAVLSIVGVLVFVATSAQHRSVLKTAGPWIAAALACLLFLPVVIWNWQHEWVSFAFQGGRALPGASGGFTQLLGSLLAQFGYLAPCFMPLLAAAILRATPRDTPQLRKYFVLLAVPPIAVFTGLNLMKRGLPHWTMSGWVFAFPLLGAETSALSFRIQRVARQVAVGWGASLAIAIAAALTYLNTGFANKFIDLVLPHKVDGENQLIRELTNWTEVADAWKQGRVAYHNALFVGGLTWRTTGRVDAALSAYEPVLCICASPNDFRFSADLNRFNGADGLLIDWPENFARSSALLDSVFSGRQIVGRVKIIHGGYAISELLIERVEGLKPTELVNIWKSNSPQRLVGDEHR